jgi:ubiquinone/menaquinone biosynthesis C-methylase UbiE
LNTEKRDFDKVAASWDANPVRLKLADDIARTVSEQVVLNPMMDVLDFGCGTGLLTLRLQPNVHSITGADSSKGMLDVLKEKIAGQNLDNVKTLYVDPDDAEGLKGGYHLIVSAMTLHHVKDVRALLDQLYRVTAPSGHLCLADLDSEDGKFHDTNEGVFHFGFDRSVLRKTFIESGFSDVRDTTATEVVKPDATGAMRRFTVFLMTGRKNP